MPLASDLQERLGKMFAESVFPSKKFNTYDASCVTHVNKLNDNQRYVYRMKKPVVNRYSDLYLDFIINNLQKDKDYLFKMRERYKKNKPKR